MKFQSTNKHLSLLEDYYNHFSEDTRLDKKHGYVEFYTNMFYIKKYLKGKMKILDIGAGTGKYSLALKNLNQDVTAVEILDKHIEIFKKKTNDIPIYKANALNLSIFKDKSFDRILLFGPMYHLLKKEERIKALQEAKRILKDDGLIFISYCMNEYAVITYGFIKDNIKECIKNNELDSLFHTQVRENDLYYYARIEDINQYNKICGLKRKAIISSDGPSNYLRQTLNKMDQETYQLFLKYHLITCQRKDLLGASSHLLDIVYKK